MVRPSSGSPRRPDSGHAMTLSGTDSRVRARVGAGRCHDDAGQHGQGDDAAGVAQHRRRREQRRPSTAQAIVHGFRRWRATTHISRPAASIVRHTARPTLRSGQVRAAQAPMPRAARTANGWAGDALLGPDAVERPAARAGHRGARSQRRCRRRRGLRGRRGRGGGRRWGLVRGGGRCGHGPLLSEVGGPAGAGAPGQDGAQVRPGGSGGGRQRGDGAAVQLADPARDRQTEAGAARGVATGAEPVEDPLHAVGGDAGAVVVDLEPPGVVVDGASDHPHLTLGRAVPHRVVDQVGDELGEPGRVGDHDQVGRVGLVAHQHRPPIDEGLRHGRPEQLTDPHLGEGQRCGSGVDAGQVEQVADQGAEPLGSGSGRRAGRRRRAARRRRRGSRAGPAGRSSGVRSSCETVATSWRRCWSAVARSAAIALNARASVPTSSDEVAVTRCA